MVDESSEASDLHRVLLNGEDVEDVEAKACDDAAAVVETYDWRGRPQGDRGRKLGGKKTLYFTLGNICLWYTAYFGIFFNLVLFFKNELGEGSGAAANDTNDFLGSMFLSSILGALVAESYLGRLWGCALFQGIALLGFLLTAAATALLVSQPVTYTWHRIFFYVSIYLISIGCGGFQSTLQSLGADQFDTEPDKAAFFTRYIVLNHLGIALGDTVIVYTVTSQGWITGFAVCAAVAACAAALFLVGFPFFRQYKHKGNPYRRTLQVLVAALRKSWKVKSASIRSEDLYEEGDGAEGSRKFEKRQESRGSVENEQEDSGRLQRRPSWLDKAAVVVTPAVEVAVTEGGNERRRSAWQLSTVTEVEEMKTVVRLLPVWASSIFFNTAYSQAGTLLVEEGALMDTKISGSLSMEPATMNMFNIAAVVLLPPVYNAVVVPATRRITGLPRGLSPLQRTGAGYLFCILALCMAAALEMWRLQRVAADLAAPSIFWQLPEFVFLGCAQFMAGIAQIEFFYTYAPPSMRSLGSALALTCIALGDYLSSVLVSLVTWLSGDPGWIPKDLNDGHLDYFFWLLAGLAAVNLAFFTVTAVSFNRQQQQQRL